MRKRLFVSYKQRFQAAVHNIVVNMLNMHTHKPEIDETCIVCIMCINAVTFSTVNCTTVTMLSISNALQDMCNHAKT